MEYRCVAVSVEGFIQQLAVAYITNGYWFYVVGDIPEGKDPLKIDAKLVERYGIAISKWARCRRKRQGMANMQYLRHERLFVLLATKGRHEFFARERETLRDVRRVPIKFAGYSIGCRRGRDGCWHASVRLTARVYSEMKARLLEVGRVSSLLALEREFRGLDLELYAPIRQQVLAMWRAVNRQRAEGGLALLPPTCILENRRSVQPFGEILTNEIDAVRAGFSEPAVPTGSHSRLAELRKPPPVPSKPS